MNECRNYWSDEEAERVRGWYLDQEMSPRAIAKRLQVKVERVRRLLTTRGWTKLRSEALIAARKREFMEAAYEGRQRAQAARGQFVWTKARIEELEKLYVDDDLPAAAIAMRFGAHVRNIRRRIKWDGLFAKRKALGKKKARVRRLSDFSNVVLLRAGSAAGTTAWETALHSAPAPKTDPDARARGQRAARKTMLARAAGR